MSKYISIFFLTISVSIILWLLLGAVFDGGDGLESLIFVFGTIIIILLSFLIALIFYLIDFMKRKA